MAQVQLMCKLLIEAAPFLNILTVNIWFDISSLLPKWLEIKIITAYLACILIFVLENEQKLHLYFS